MDGTFANYDKSFSNVERSLNRGRAVEIYHLYQEPEIAWDFTKKREAIERRNIPVEIFIDAFFNSRENANRVKERFGDKVKLNLVIKNFKNDDEKILLDIKNIDDFLDQEYNKNKLREVLK